MKRFQIQHFERYLEFHREQILEHLKSNLVTDSDAESTWNSKCGSTTRILKECLLRRRDEIESALVRMREGTYGNCAGCGKEIGLQRLQVIPWAQFCIPCQEESEQRQQTENRFSDEVRVSIAENGGKIENFLS